MKHALLAALLAASTTAGASGAQAQACSTDFTGLASQVSSEAVSQKLGTTVDEIITHAGGLTPAVAQYDTELARLRALEAALAGQPPSDDKQLILDSVVFISAIADALRCRQSQ